MELAQAAAITQLAVWRAAHAHALAPTDLTVVRLPKMIADLQAKEAIRCAHQAHGAIGMTREYPLHRLTRRLHTWSLDNSDESPSQGLADAVVQRGSLTRFVWNPGWPS
ncbi:Uncharacterised protein [Actinomadura madurae]|nr:Uncharacterised protein [Actinomadura madurae]